MSATRPRGVLVPAGPEGLAALRPALAAAFHGDGAPVCPLPAEGRLVTATSAALLRTTLRPDEPSEYNDVVAVVPTSGSTGDPKGVYWTKASLTHAATAFAERFGTGTVVLTLPLTSAAGMMALLRSVIADTDSVAMSSLGGEHPFTVEDFVATTEAAAGYAAPLHTSLIDEQLRRLLNSTDGVAALTRYACVLVGGGPVGDTVVRAKEHGIAIHTSYGMTETCGGCWYDNAPLEGVTITTSPDGRLVVSGPVVSPGYRFRADAAFLGHSFITSDLGAVVDGKLTITGRVDDAVKVNGVLVDLAAVERVVRKITGASAIVARVRDGLEVVIEADEINTQEVVAAVRDELNARLLKIDMAGSGTLPRLPGGKIDIQRVRSAG